MGVHPHTVPHNGEMVVEVPVPFPVPVPVPVSGLLPQRATSPSLRDVVAAGGMQPPDHLMMPVAPRNFSPPFGANFGMSSAEKITCHNNMPISRPLSPGSYCSSSSIAALPSAQRMAAPPRAVSPAPYSRPEMSPEMYNSCSYAADYAACISPRAVSPLGVHMMAPDYGACFSPVLPMPMMQPRAGSPVHVNCVPVPVPPPMPMMQQDYAADYAACISPRAGSPMSVIPPSPASRAEAGAMMMQGEPAVDMRSTSPVRFVEVPVPVPVPVPVNAEQYVASMSPRAVPPVLINYVPVPVPAPPPMPMMQPMQLPPRPTSPVHVRPISSGAVAQPMLTHQQQDHQQQHKSTDYRRTVSAAENIGTSTEYRQSECTIHSTSMLCS